MHQQIFVNLPMADVRQSTSGWVCLSCDSREQVDVLVAKAAAAGGTTPREAKDYDFMDSHGFEEIVRL